MSVSIHTRAPGRVNLIGDHTDYTGGLVFPMAIDRWTDVVGVVSERIELTSDHERDPVRIEPGGPAPTGGWGRYVSAVATELGAARGIDGRVTTSIPVGAGLSSSAALELAVALALGFDGTPLGLAQLGRRAEHRATGVPCGIMDQLCIAAARRDHATMIDCHSLEVTHVRMPADVDVIVRFIEHRTLDGSPYADRVSECQVAESIIGPLRTAVPAAVDAIADPVIRRRARHVISENQRVLDFADALGEADYRAAGQLMVESHMSLRDDFDTSTQVMDAAVDDALRQPGVLGARMTGGGFGGCIVILVERGANLDGWLVAPVDGAHVVAASG